MEKLLGGDDEVQHLTEMLKQLQGKKIASGKGGKCSNQRYISRELMEWFSTCYKKERKFSEHVNSHLFIKVLEELLDISFDLSVNSENILHVVICLRMLLRDIDFQQQFMTNDVGLSHFSEVFSQKVTSYLSCTEENLIVDIVSNLASIFQKVSYHHKNHGPLIRNKIHTVMLHLLKSSDLFILHCSLDCLSAFAESNVLRTLIIKLHSVELIVQIIQEYDNTSKILAANLLRTLCSDDEICQQMIIYDSLPVLLSVLNDAEQCELLRHVVWILVLLCRDTSYANEIRLLGGIPILLNLLNKDRVLTCNKFEISKSQSPADKEELLGKKLKLYSACCFALSEMALDDRCTQSIVQTNGLFVIAKLILPQKFNQKHQTGKFMVQRNAFRALRFLFSMERNRKMFKRLFPAEMFQDFIDIGHYVRESDSYKPLVSQINNMKSDEVDSIRESIQELNQNKTPKRFIRDYAIYDILGSGAFGSVYRVKKKTSQIPLALKEVSVATGGGKTGQERRKKEIDEIVRELSIIREQLRHTNVVRYYSTFEENDKLYIEMELIEGASLQEHFTSLKEKGERGMGEERVWRVFIQMCLALRYLHCDKRIVHRDLTPNNVMLGENDKVTITDFGLAKQKKETSKMMSAVGTLLYSCPEIIKNIPYEEKADIWALGCILYQMATLEPPFMSSNMLALATKIVHAEYAPINEEWGYSDLVVSTVRKCLTVEPDERPDIIMVGGLIVDRMLHYTDHITNLYNVAEKRVEKERKRTQRHCHEARRNREDYQTLFQASQENSERRVCELSDGSVSSNEVPSVVSRLNSDEAEVFINDSDCKRLESPVIESRLGENNKPWSRPTSASTKKLHPPSPDLRVPRRALSFDLAGLRNNSEPANSKIDPPFTPNGNQPLSTRRPFSSGGSSAGMLSISPSKVRQIKDPVQQTLMQLHKIIYIDQLPPTSIVNYRRRIISRYKRALFSPNSRSSGLKDELKKLYCGSLETIDVSFIVENPLLTQRATAEVAAKELLGTNHVPTQTDGEKLYEEGVSYAQMQNIIEHVLRESGYYNIAGKPTNHRSDLVHRSNTVPNDLSIN